MAKPMIENAETKIIDGSACMPLFTGECPACGSSQLSWGCEPRTHSRVVDGRLKMNEIHVIFYLGCDACSETVRVVRGEEIAAFLSNSIHCVAREDWIRERWGGFTYLVIGRNEDFMLDFKDGSLWLHYESRNSPVGRVMLFEMPTRQGVIDAERMFGCK